MIILSSPGAEYFCHVHCCRKCVLQQLILCTSRFAINSSVKAIQAVVCLLSSLIFPTIVAWNQGPSPTVLRGGQRCEIEEEVSGETMSETRPMHSRNVLEIRWCPTKEPVKPLGCRVTLPKTRMEPEDKPKDQEGCDQDHLKGQAQRRMLDTSSSSCKSICYRSQLIDLIQIPIDQLLIT